jgi:hypothetical protein
MTALMTTAPDRRQRPDDKPLAAEVLLIAASLLRSEFTEWDLTVQCWRLDPERFGMRGYTLLYPDHKRVYAEIMGDKYSNPVKVGWMTRTCANHYTLTLAGRAHAERMKDPEGCEKNYAAVERFIQSPPFTRWMDKPEEPRTLAELLDTLDGTVAEAEMVVASAREWMKAHGTNYLTRFKKHGRTQPSFDLQHLSSLADFATAMRHRFPQLTPRKARRA